MSPEPEAERPGQQHESLSEPILEDVIFTTSLSPEGSSSLPDTRFHSRLRGVLLPSLPYAKGAQNYFLGEFEDAGQTGVLTGLLSCARKDGLSLKNLPWASLRSPQTMSAALLAFGSMSTLGIDYRQYGLSPKYPKDILDVYDIRSENTAETWTGTGVAVGAVVGALSARNVARRFRARPLPNGVGITVAFATWFNTIGSLVQGTPLVK